MFDPFYVTVAVQALLTLVVLRLAATGQEHFGFPKLLLVTLGLTVVGAALQQALAPHLGLFHLVPQAAVTLYVLHDVCWLTWRRASVYAAILGILMAGIGYGASRVCGQGDTGDGLAPLVDLAPLASVTNAIGPPSVAPIPSPASIPPFDASADWAGARRGLHVEGRLSYSDQAYVLVNEHVFTHGQTISHMHGGSNYTWQVVVDASNGVSLLPLHIQAVARP